MDWKYSLLKREVNIPTSRIFDLHVCLGVTLQGIGRLRTVNMNMLNGYSKVVDEHLSFEHYPFRFGAGRLTAPSGMQMDAESRRQVILKKKYMSESPLPPGVARVTGQEWYQQQARTSIFAVFSKSRGEGGWESEETLAVDAVFVGLWVSGATWQYFYHTMKIV